MSHRIEISNQQNLLAIDDRRLVEIVESVLTAHGLRESELHLLLVDNAAIHEINRAHLRHDFPTDVITFPLNDPDRAPPEYPLEGELVISAEMALELAADIGWEAEQELQLYLIHGLLHLCGYDDLDDTARACMRRREWEMLRQLGITPQARDERWAQLPP